MELAGLASVSGADTIECGYQTAAGSYAFTPNLAQAVTSTSTSSLTLAAATAATDGANQSSTRLYFNGNAYSTVNSNSYSTGHYLQNVLTNTAQSPINTLTLGIVQSGGLTGTFAVDFSAAKGGFKAAGLTDTGVISATALGTNSSGVVAAASTTGSGNVVLATSPTVSGLTDTGSTSLTNLSVRLDLPDLLARPDRKALPATAFLSRMRTEMLSERCSVVPLERLSRFTSRDISST